MKLVTKNLVKFAVISIFVSVFTGVITTSAATTPSPGTTNTYAILSSTYTNTTLGTIINGDIGFTTGPAVVPGGSHPIYGSVIPYATAGIDQSNILSNLALQPCTYTFAAGAIDLATDVGHGTIGIYTPGVYCTTALSAATIGVAGITLNGAGTYIFRIGGALDSVANSNVTLSGASSCDVFWTPTGATTLGANSTFAGINIDSAGITVGNGVSWNGRALVFGGTVTTGLNSTMTMPNCSVAAVTATLNVIKQVVNTGGGTAIPSDFTLSVINTGSGINLSNSGMSSPGMSYTLTGGVYSVSEIANASYSQSFTGDCSLTGSITLAPNDNKTCILTNTYIAPVILPVVVNNNSGGGGMATDFCPNGDLSSSYYDGKCGAVVTSTGTTTGSVITQTGITIVKPIVKPKAIIITPKPLPVVIPKLPATGIISEDTNILNNALAIAGLLILTITFIVIMRKKNAL